MSLPLNLPIIRAHKILFLNKMSQGHIIKYYLYEGEEIKIVYYKLEVKISFIIYYV